jgi:acyl carrier protein
VLPFTRETDRSLGRRGYLTGQSISAASPETLPKTDLEIQIATIWSDVLGVEGLDMRSGFFEIGGHSLTAMRIVNRIRTQFGVDVKLRLLFEYPTLGDFSRAIDKSIYKQRY